MGTITVPDRSSDTGTLEEDDDGRRAATAIEAGALEKDARGSGPLQLSGSCCEASMAVLR